MSDFSIRPMYHFVLRGWAVEIGYRVGITEPCICGDLRELWVTPYISPYND